MAIPQVSNSELYFHKVHVGSSSLLICTVEKNVSPKSLDESIVLLHFCFEVKVYPMSFFNIQV